MPAPETLNTTRKSKKLATKCHQSRLDGNRNVREINFRVAKFRHEASLAKIKAAMLPQIFNKITVENLLRRYHETDENE